MDLLAHVGFEHPNLVWLAAVGVMAFVAGLGVNLYRSLTDASIAGETAPEAERSE